MAAVRRHSRANIVFPFRYRSQRATPERLVSQPTTTSSTPPGALQQALKRRRAASRRATLHAGKAEPSLRSSQGQRTLLQQRAVGASTLRDYRKKYAELLGVRSEAMTEARQWGQRVHRQRHRGFLRRALSERQPERRWLQARQRMEVLPPGVQSRRGRSAAPHYAVSQGLEEGGPKSEPRSSPPGVNASA